MKEYIFYPLVVWLKTTLIQLKEREKKIFFAPLFAYLALILARSIEKSVGGDNTKLLIYLYFLILILIFGLSKINLPKVQVGTWEKEQIKNEEMIDIFRILGVMISCISLLFVSEILVIYFLLAFALFQVFNAFNMAKNTFEIALNEIIAGIFSAIALYKILGL